MNYQSLVWENVFFLSSPTSGVFRNREVCIAGRLSLYLRSSFTISNICKLRRSAWVIIWISIQRSCNLITAFAMTLQKRCLQDIRLFLGPIKLIYFQILCIYWTVKFSKSEVQVFWEKISIVSLIASYANIILYTEKLPRRSASGVCETGAPKWKLNENLPCMPTN